MDINNFNSEQESTEQYLSQHGVSDPDAIQLDMDTIDQRSTDQYLRQYGADNPEAMQLFDQYEEKKHRRISRSFIVRRVSFISIIITICLLVLLTLSGLPKSSKFRFRLEFTERLQFGILGAGILNYLALYYIIVSDLFPDGKAPTEKSYVFEDDEEDNENN